jgi:hypothetical protein
MFTIVCIELYCRNGMVLFICFFDAWNILVVVHASPHLQSGGIKVKLLCVEH